MNRWRPAKPGDHAYDGRLREWAAPVLWDNSPLPGFAPDFDPLRMLTMGVFGGAYFGGDAGRERLTMLPGKFHSHGTTRYTNIRGAQCKNLNRFGKPASLPKAWWLDRGLITSADPLGWFEWYCWTTVGRRIPGYDAWQVARWAKFRQRHGRMYWLRPTPGQAQALLHWAVSPILIESHGVDNAH